MIAFIFLCLAGCNDIKYRVLDEKQRTASLVEVPTGIHEFGSYFTKSTDIDGYYHRVIQIDSNALKGSTYLRIAQIPDNIEFIGENAFINCPSLYYVQYTGFSDIKFNGQVFDSHVKVLVPLQYKSETFCGAQVIKTNHPERDFATKLVYRIYGEDNKLAAFVRVPLGIHELDASFLQNAIFNDNQYKVSVIDANAASNSPYLRIVRIPDHIEFIGENAFTNCPSLYYIQYNGLSDIKFNGQVFDSHVKVLVPLQYKSETFCGAQVIKTNHPERDFATKLVYRIYGEDNKLAAFVRVPLGIHELDASFLQNAIFNDNQYKVSVIDANAASNSPYLRIVRIPDHIEFIGENAFINCPSLYYVQYTGFSDIKFNGQVFDSHVKVLVPLQYKSETFCGAQVIKTNHPERDFATKLVYRIYGEDNKLAAFVRVPLGIHELDASFLQNAIFNDNQYKVSVIDANAASNSPYLRIVRIPDHIEFIGENAFTNCPSLYYIQYNGLSDIKFNGQVFDSHVKVLVPLQYKSETFCGAQVIKTNHPERDFATKLVYRIYGEDNKLAAFVRVPLGIHELDASFLQNAIFNDNQYKVSVIDANAASNSPYLRIVRIPDHIEFIGENAFINCPSLYYIQYNGLSDIKFNGQVFDSHVKVLVPLQYKSETFCGAQVIKTNHPERDFATKLVYRIYGEDNKLAAFVRVPLGIHELDASFLQNAIFNDNQYKVSVIDANAASNSPYLRIVRIPDHIEFIGENAFTNCPSLYYIQYNGLSDIKFAGKVFDDNKIVLVSPEYKDETFCGAPVIKTSNPQKEFARNLVYRIHGEEQRTAAFVRVPEGIHEFDSSFIKLTEFNGLKYRVTVIDSNAASNSQYLKIVRIPDNIEFIGENAFSNCSSLNYVDFEGVSDIKFNGKVFDDDVIVRVSEKYGGETFCGNKVVRQKCEVTLRSILSAVSASTSSSNKSLSNSTKVLISIGSVALFAGVAILAFVIYKKKNSKKDDEEPMLNHLDSSVIFTDTK